MYRQAEGNLIEDGGFDENPSSNYFFLQVTDTIPKCLDPPLSCCHKVVIAGRLLLIMLIIMELVMTGSDTQLIAELNI